MSEVQLDSVGGNDVNIYPVRNAQGTGRNIPIFWVYPKSSTTPVWLTTLEKNLIDLTVSYSLSGATALTFSVFDPGFELLRQNYFQTGQTLIYRSHNSNFIASNKSGIFATPSEQYLAYFFEIADVVVEQNQGNSPIVRVQCYTKAIQQMKRDRKPGNIKGSGTDFVLAVAKKYGLECVAQKTSATRQITTADSDTAADSVWTVLDRLAGESKDEQKNPFVVFESDGTLYFGSQQFLMYKWGATSFDHQKLNKKTGLMITQKRYITYLRYPSLDEPFILLKMPTLHKSENDPLDGDGSCVLDRINGTRMRPGMTVRVEGVPWFDGDFLVQSVDFSELTPDAVNVSFARPPRRETLIKQYDVGEIYPGSVEWATVVGLLEVQPSIMSPEKGVANSQASEAEYS